MLIRNSLVLTLASLTVLTLWYAPLGCNARHKHERPDVLRHSEHQTAATSRQSNVKSGLQIDAFNPNICGDTSRKSWMDQESAFGCNSSLTNRPNNSRGNDCPLCNELHAIIYYTPFLVRVKVYVNQIFED
jgi:hypothetical protein